MFCMCACRQFLVYTRMYIAGSEDCNKLYHLAHQFVPKHKLNSHNILFRYHFERLSDIRARLYYREQRVYPYIHIYMVCVLLVFMRVQICVSGF